jgi:hypothetical protein
MKAKKRPATSSSDVNYAWAAGFIDGEGCFSYGTSPRLTVENTHLPSLLWLRRLFGVGTITKRKNLRRGRQSYSWDVSGDKCLWAITRLLPYLREKKPQAELLFEIRAKRPAERAELKQKLKDLKRPSFAHKQHQL